MDMIIEILIRLPVKFIIRFKCVSKDWHSLITSQHFIDRHLQQSCKPLSNRLLILQSDLSRYDDQSNPFYSLSINNPNSNPTKLPLPLPPKQIGSHSAVYEVFGNCNGVICITVTDPVSQMLMLYNPSTCSSRWVESEEDRECLGLGYDVITGDYKILAERNPEFYEVFSLRRNSWKRCGDARLPVKIGFAFDYPGIYMKGALHWFVERGEGISGQSLLVFDMHNETFHSELFPDCFELFNYKGLIFSDLGSDLSLQMYNYQVQQGGKMSVIVTLDVWVMKEYGVQESWTKLFAFPAYGLFGDDPCATSYSSDGTKILLTQSTGARLWYMLKTGDMEAKNDRFCLNHEKLVTLDVCVESLVSLHDY